MKNERERRERKRRKEKDTDRNKRPRVISMRARTGRTREKRGTIKTGAGFLSLYEEET